MGKGLSECHLCYTSVYYIHHIRSMLTVWHISVVDVLGDNQNFNQCPPIWGKTATCCVSEDQSSQVMLQGSQTVKTIENQATVLLGSA